MFFGDIGSIVLGQLTNEIGHNQDNDDSYQPSFHI